MRVLNIVSLLTFFSTSVHLNKYFQRLPSQAIDSTVKVISNLKKSGHCISKQISIITCNPYKNPILYNKHKRLSSPFPSLQTLDLHKQEHDIKASGHRRNTCLFFVTYLFIIYTLNHVKIWNSSWKKRRCTKSKQCSVWKYKWFSAGKKYVFCQSIMY